MLRIPILAAIALAIAFGLGTATAWVSMTRLGAFGATKVGNWSAYPVAGTPLADPYSKARAAREGSFSLGAAEGISFYAQNDDDGRQLEPNCTYQLKGTSPSARFWTIYAAGPDLLPLPAGPDRLAGLHSRELLREADSSFLISVAATAQPGNWLAVSGTRPMTLVMTLYDSSAASSSGMIDITFPSIRRVGCNV